MFKNHRVTSTVPQPPASRCLMPVPTAEPLLGLDPEQDPEPGRAGTFKIEFGQASFI
eukprot:Ihof_evm1s1326 gene=Ihof_evmTU1s1326